MSVIFHVNCDQDPDADVHSSESDTSTMLYYEAEIKYTFRKGHDFATRSFQGKFGLGHQPSSSNVSGKAVHVKSFSKSGTAKYDHLGCDRYAMKLPSVKWVALVERGQCNFSDKIRTATEIHNASAILIYDNETQQNNFMRHKDINKNVAVFISKEKGLELAHLLDNGINIDINICLGQRYLHHDESNNKKNSSVLFLSVSFSIVVIIAVSWLMYYYIRKFRYSHAKERLAKRLARAAKKAIAKIPQRTLTAGDKELEKDYDQCAVCIEPYNDGDIIRLMPCRHVFHKSCVDPWLMDHRTCPMCKLDILQAFGMSMGKIDLLAYGMQGSQEFTHRNMDAEAVMLESIPSVDGRMRVETGAMVLDDQEPSSSLEDEIQENAEVKVVLVPHSCLHYHHHSNEAGRGDVLEEDKEEEDEYKPSTSLLADYSARSTDAVCGSRDFVSKVKNYDKLKVQNCLASLKADCESGAGTEALIQPSGGDHSDPDHDETVTCGGSSGYTSLDCEAGVQKSQENKADSNV